ncbi:MAG: methionyl-tRNA formyltransferase [Clostridiales bacterium]|nr:methionyl-tRNA formyltransferase [Clostridiales bacterium]
MRIAFLGTPEFALPSLQALYDAGHELNVFTQPDRPKDRGHGLKMPPVKELALSLGLPVYQFEKIRREEGVAALSSFAPDLMVTAAFGQILSQENLDIPRYGCINVHGSLLPKYRGAAPIQWSVINGETETGVTTMMTDIGLDTGDILMTRRTPIGENETAGELYDRLSVMGAELLIETVNALIDGTLTRTKQVEEDASRCGMIKKYMAGIDFGKSVKEVHDLIRGMNPAPVAFTAFDGQPLKVFRSLIPEVQAEGYEDAAPGECVIADSKKGLYVKCLDGIIEICELQFSGSRRMDAKSALNSKKMLGKTLGK